MAIELEEIDAMSLMPLETPVLKVSRPVAACSRCRNAKIKCDGKLPACSSCEKNGRAAECTSTNDQFARGKERSYVSTLETRIDKLQTKLEEARARKPSVVSIPDESETAVPSRRQSQAAPELPLSPTSSKKQKRREVTAIDDLVSDFGFLSVNATARDFYGFTTAMSYARLILSACSKEELPRGTTKALPPRYVATALVQHYLNNIFILLPVFDEASFYASFDNMYSSNPRKAEPFDHWIVRMVLAIGSVSMSRQRGDPHYMEGIGHVCAALEYAEIVLHPGNTAGVQALVLLTEYAMLDPHHFDSWSLIGAASRAMTDLGLHQDPPKGANMTKGKLELRRKVFHCIYALDRSTSLVQTRAFSFSDDSARVKIPFHKPSSAPTSPTGNGPSQKQWLQSYEQAMDLINLRRLQSVWYTDLFQSGRTRWEEPYPYLWDTCDAMRKWFDNISPTTTPNMRAFFELDLLYSYVYVLSPSPRVPSILPFAQKLIFEYCIRYANLMIRLISDHQYTAPLTFYDAMRVYMTGRQFLDVLQHNTDLLLNGFIPPHPEVKPTTAPPPPMPVEPPPTGESIQRFNTVRSLNCINNIKKCLELFGIRWGYLSWSQRYQNETSEVLQQLDARLRELDEMNGMRRQSMWYGSAGSLPSSNGSISYTSPSSSMSHVPTMYHQQQSSPPMQQAQATAYGAPPTGQQMSPQAVPPQPNMYPQQQQHPQHGHSYGQMPPPQHYHQPQPQQQFSFNEPVYQTNRPARPSQQFAAWGGYGGTTVQDTLDEENAYHLGVPDAAGQVGMNIREASDAPQTSRQPLARLGPSPRASVAPTQVGGQASNVPIQARGHQDSTVFPLEIPQTAHLPPFAWTSPIVGPDPGRRISMRDAALDVIQSTYPPPLNQLPYGVSPTRTNPNQSVPRYPSFSFVPIAPKPPQESLPPAQPPIQQEAPPQVRAQVPPNPIVYGRGDDQTVYRVREPYGEEATVFDKGGFSFRKVVGYVCIVCGRVCPKPSEHRTLEGGAGCIDFSAEYRSMQPWRSLDGEGMQVCQGIKEEEERALADCIARLPPPQRQPPPQIITPDARSALNVMGQQNKGKAPVRNESWYRVGAQEANWITLRTLEAHVRLRSEMQDAARAAGSDQDVTGGIEAEKRLSGAAGLFF